MSDRDGPASSTSSFRWLDAQLASWPDVQRTDAAKEAAAEAVMARIAKGERGTSLASQYEDAHDGNIFSSPLGQTPEESHNTAASAAAKSTTSAAPASSRARGKSEESMSMSSDRERDRRSLQDLAKLAANTNTPAPSSVRFDVGPLSSPASSRKEEDSGLVNLMAFAPQAEPAPASVKAPPPPPASVAPASAAAGPASVRPSAPPASVPAPSSIGAAVVSAAVPSVDAPLSGPEVAAASVAAPASVPVIAASASVAGANENKKGNGKIIAIGGLFAAAAIAAGVFFATRKPVEEPSAQNTPPAAEAPKATGPAKPAENTQAAAEPAKEEPSTAAATPAGHAKTPVAHAGGPAVAKVETKDKPETKEDKKVEAKDLPASQGGNGDLGAAMRAAAGPGGNTESSDKTSGPQFAAGSVPQKPSQGAITGALGAVLGQARACVAEDDPISRANVTFASAGNVQSVSVSGGAAGKPAEACIKAALSKAHVAPFAEATYSAPVTIRH